MTSPEFRNKNKEREEKDKVSSPCSYAGLTFDWAKKFKPNFDRYARMWVQMGRRII